MNRYVLGSEKVFYDFIDSLSKDDKIGIITHVDLDGLASGIFLQKILEFKGLEPAFMEFFVYRSDILEPLLERDFDVLFFTDWNADNFPDYLDKLRKKVKVLVVDHHPLNEELEDKSNIIKTISGYCSAHALFDLADKKNLFNTKEWIWLVCSAIIMDYIFNNEENSKFLEECYPGIDKNDIWNSEPGKTGQIIGNSLIYYRDDIKKVYDLVLEKDFDELRKDNDLVEEEISKWVEKFKTDGEYFPEKKLHFYVGGPKYPVASVIATKLSDEDFKDDTVVFVSDSNTQEGFVKLSARNQTGKINLSKILKKSIEGFEDSSAGGHVKASAGNFPKKYLGEFKKRLLENL